MLVFHIFCFRCHKQILPEELSSCLNTKPEILRTKPDIVCKVGLLSSKFSQNGTGDLKPLSEPKGSCTQLKTNTDKEDKLESVSPSSAGLPRECLPIKPSTAELEIASTPELQKHLEYTPSTSDVLSNKPEEKAGVSSNSPNSCVEKKIEPSTLGCRSQNLKESSVKIDNESCCTRSNNKIQNGECFYMSLLVEGKRW